MFDLREFIKSGLIKAVGKMADYRIILNAVGWLEKGVFEENDLADIESAINAQCPEENTSEREEAEDDQQI